MKRKLTDIFAMVVFCTITNFVVEVFLSGMSVNQSISARLTAISINMLIAAPYGKYRDWILKVAFDFKKSTITMFFADIFAYASFLSPVYAIILFYERIPLHTILSATGLNLLFSFLLGGVYGYFLDFTRRAFNVHNRL